MVSGDSRRYGKNLEDRNKILEEGNLCLHLKGIKNIHRIEEKSLTTDIYLYAIVENVPCMGGDISNITPIYGEFWPLTEDATIYGIFGSLLPYQVHCPNYELCLETGHICLREE